MNKLIEKLIDKFETECHLSFDCIEKEKFKQAIQTACKAQRNACARVYERDYIYKGGYSVHDCIVDAEITKEDYE